MALVNGTFLVPGTQRYDAASWVRTTANAVLIYAGFAGDSTTQDFDGKEGFESGWGASLFALRGFFLDLTYGFFDAASGTPKDVEDFEDLWGATAARLVSGHEAPFVLVDGMTLSISVMDRPAVVITFTASQFNDISDARAGEIANVLNETLIDARATVEDRRVVIVTDRTGPGAHLRVTGGTANSVLDFETAEAPGGAAGASFFRQVEFDFGVLDTFETGRGPVRLAADPTGSLGYFTILPADPLSWSTLVTTFTPTFFALVVETFYGGWDDLDMQTYFPPV